jgi:hypothetical protein
MPNGAVTLASETIKNATLPSYDRLKASLTCRHGNLSRSTSPRCLTDSRSHRAAAKRLAAWGLPRSIEVSDLLTKIRLAKADPEEEGEEEGRGPHGAYGLGGAETGFGGLV